MSGAVAAARLVWLPPVYRGLVGGRYPLSFLEQLAADLGPDVDAAVLPGVLAARLPAWERREAVTTWAGDQRAEHEAAHAVVARALGGIVMEVDMSPTNTSDARTRVVFPGDGGRPGDADMFFVCVLLAAHVWGADAGAHPSVWCGCGQDLARASALVTGMRAAGSMPAVWPGEVVPVDAQGGPDVLAWAVARTGRVLAGNRAVVAALTSVLAARPGSVPGWELHQVLSRVVPGGAA